MQLFYSDTGLSESELERVLRGSGHHNDASQASPQLLDLLNTTLFDSAGVLNSSNSSGSGGDDTLPVNIIYICIILSVIIVVGVVSNAINVVVFSRKTMRSASTFRFLLYLSICDMMVLIACSTDALIRFGFDFEVFFSFFYKCRIVLKKLFKNNNFPSFFLGKI
jgi:hypothetical protein